MLVVGLGCVVFVLILSGAEAATRRWTIDAELSRKFVHLSSGLTAAGLPAVMSFGSIVVLAGLFIPFMVVSRRIGLFPAVHGVERATWGEIYFPLGVLLAAAFVPHPAPYVYGVLVMGISDPCASVAGQRYGRRAYRVLTAHKTYVGSAAFFATAFALTVGVLAATAGFTPASLAVGASLATILTVLEGVTGGGVDNVVLPLAGAGLLALAA